MKSVMIEIEGWPIALNHIAIVGSIKNGEYGIDGKMTAGYCFSISMANGNEVKITSILLADLTRKRSELLSHFKIIKIEA